MIATLKLIEPTSLYALSENIFHVDIDTMYQFHMQGILDDNRVVDFIVQITLRNEEPEIPE